MASAIRGWHCGRWAYRTPADIPAGVLAGLIYAHRHKAERAAIERFRWYVIEDSQAPIHERSRVKRWGISPWGQVEADRLKAQFWYHQSRLLMLWAERCRRVAAGDVPTCLRDL